MSLPGSAEDTQGWAEKTAHTRRYMSELFSSFALDNFGASFGAAVSDDLVWTVTGSSPIAGRYDSKQTYMKKVLQPLRDVLETLPVPIVDQILVDGDWTVVNWHSAGVKGKNGADYDMQYVWMMRLQGEKIVEVKGFYDGEKVSKVFEGYEFKER